MKAKRLALILPVGLLASALWMAGAAFAQSDRPEQRDQPRPREERVAPDRDRGDYRAPARPFADGWANRMRPFGPGLAPAAPSQPAIAFHGNKMFVVIGRTLYRVNPDTLEVERSTFLAPPAGAVRAGERALPRPGSLMGAPRGEGRLAPRQERQPAPPRPDGQESR